MCLFVVTPTCGGRLGSGGSKKGGFFFLALLLQNGSIYLLQAGKHGVVEAS
jgi:hypothetical protein